MPAKQTTHTPTRDGLTEEQRDMVYRAAGYANAMIALPKSKTAKWIEEFSARLKTIAAAEGLAV